MRDATLADLPMLRAWDEQPHVIASDPDSDWEWEIELQRRPAWRTQWIAVAEGRDIGVVQIIDPEAEDSHYWGDCGPGLRAIDIWIGPPDALGRGFGTSMMSVAITRCFAEPDVHAILIDPLVGNVGAIRFYRRLGFEFVEERDFDGDLCAVHRLTRSRWRSSSQAVVGRNPGGGE